MKTMHVFIIAALSVDGFLAENDAQTSTTWTSKEDSQFFRQRTKDAGVMVVGRKTYQTIGRPLPNRLNIVYSSQTPTEELPENLRYTQATPTELVSELEKEGFTELAVCGGSSIYTQFLQAGVVDTLYITIEPLLFGQGVSLFDQPLSGQKLRLQKVTPLSEQTLLLEYACQKV